MSILVSAGYEYLSTILGYIRPLTLMFLSACRLQTWSRHIAKADEVWHQSFFVYLVFCYYTERVIMLD
jgi:hypothetical protein